MGNRLSVDLDPAVQPTHVQFRQQAAQLGEGRYSRRDVLSEACTHQRSGFVRRKKASIVLQDHQIIAQDEAVRRVAIDHVHLTGGECLILDRGQEGTDRAEADSVGAPKPR
jgi:hypothetical protein